MTARRLLIVGRGKFAIDCLKIIRRLAPECELSILAETEPAALGMTLAKFCEREKIEYLEFEKLDTKANLNRAQAFRADLGISVNNFQIVKPSLLKSPRQGFINFHNGPLPSYGGLNVCSWAILNGEPDYGVTWHFIDEGIDTGDIITQRHFPIPGDATALSLTMTCFKAGLEMFEELAPMIASGSIPRQAQPSEPRCYFSKRDIPNGGQIDFNWSYDRIDRFVRGLSFQPLPNPFVYPWFTHKNAIFYVLSLETRVGSGKPNFIPGTVEEIGKQGISVCCGDGMVVLCELMDAEFKVISLENFVSLHRVVVGGLFD